MSLEPDVTTYKSSFSKLNTINWLEAKSTRQWASTALLDPPPRFGSEQRTRLLQELQTEEHRLRSLDSSTSWETIREQMISHARSRAVLSPMRCLAPELLGEIFLHALTSKSPRSFGAYARQLNIAMLVCRRWRDVCTLIPDFWARVDFGSFGRRCSSSGLDVWLERSKAAPLRVHLTVDRYLNADCLLTLQMHANKIQLLTLLLDDSTRDSSEDAVVRTFDFLVNGSTSIEELSVYGSTEGDVEQIEPHFKLYLPKLRTLDWAIWLDWDGASFPALKSASFTRGFPSFSMLRSICTSVEYLTFNALNIPLESRNDTGGSLSFPLLKSVTISHAEHIRDGPLLVMLRSTRAPITAIFCFPLWVSEYDHFLHLGLHNRITEIHVALPHRTNFSYQDQVCYLAEFLKEFSPTLEKLYFEPPPEDLSVASYSDRVTPDLTVVLESLLMLEDELPASRPLLYPNLRELHLTGVTLSFDVVCRVAGQRSDLPNPFRISSNEGIVSRPCRVFFKQRGRDPDLDAETRTALAVGSWESFWRQQSKFPR